MARKRNARQNGYYQDHPEFGFCRGLANHLFKVKELSPEKAGVTSVILYCTVCKGERHDTVDMSNGEILRRSYSYRPGYILKPPSGKSRIPKSDIRLGYIKYALKENR